MPATRPPASTRSRAGARPHGRPAGAYAAWDLATADARVAAGLPTDALHALGVRLGLSQASLARALGMSESTLGRRRPGRTLPPDESERVYRLGRLADLAEHALGSADDARAWLHEPNFGLGDRVPLELARTEPGARLVEHALAAIEHGLPV